MQGLNMPQNSPPKKNTTFFSLSSKNQILFNVLSRIFMTYLLQTLQERNKNKLQNKQKACNIVHIQLLHNNSTICLSCQANYIRGQDIWSLLGWRLFPPFDNFFTNEF